VKRSDFIPMDQRAEIERLTAKHDAALATLAEIEPKYDAALRGAENLLANLAAAEEENERLKRGIKSAGEVTDAALQAKLAAAEAQLARLMAGIDEQCDLAKKAGAAAERAAISEWLRADYISGKEPAAALWYAEQIEADAHALFRGAAHLGTQPGGEGE
jgi:septal ring factor EnvC (AmiA/AmiB activator)